MAHGDYECCACCDRKVNYSPFCESKAVLCPECAVSISLATRHRISGVPELLRWIKGTPNTDAWPVLVAAGYEKCIFSNKVDDEVEVLRKGMLAEIANEAQEAGFYGEF